MNEPAGREGLVYPEREDTRLLLPFADGARGLLVLEVGTGNGAIALRAAAGGARVVATDVNVSALRRLRARAVALGLPLELVRADGLSGFRRFDRILFNPPYLPTPPGGED